MVDPGEGGKLSLGLEVVWPLGRACPEGLKLIRVVGALELKMLNELKFLSVNLRCLRAG